MWDISLVEYRRNDLKDVHWEEVGSKLELNFSCAIVKKRFTNMRDIFMENHKKVRDSKRSGSGAEHVYRPKWPLYGSLQFLLKTVAQAESISNVDIPEGHLKDSGTPGWDSVNSASTSVSVYYDENFQQFMLIPSEPTATSQQSSLESYGTPVVPVTTASSSGSASSSTSAVSSAGAIALVSSPLSSPLEPVRPSSAPPSSDAPGMFNKSRVKRGNNNPLTEEALQIMKKIVAEPVAPPSPVEDAAEKFGAFVASKLREMDKDSRQNCEAKIVKALYD